MVVGRSSLPILDGQVAFQTCVHRLRCLLTDMECQRSTPAISRTRGLPPVFCTRAIALADGVVSPRDDRTAVGSARRRHHPVRSAIPDAGLRDAAKAEWERAAPPVRAALERYAAGVNAASAELVGRKRPIEFQILGITPPAWEPIDSLAVGRLLAWRLAENHQAELVRACARGEVWRRDGALPDRRVSAQRTVNPGGPLPARARSRRRRRGQFHLSARAGCDPCRPRVARRRERDAATATTGCWPAGGPSPAGRSSPTIRICRSSSRPFGTRCIWSRRGST